MTSLGVARHSPQRKSGPLSALRATLPKGESGDLFRRHCVPLSPKGKAVTSSVGCADTFPEGEGSDLSRRCAPLSPKGKADLFRRLRRHSPQRGERTSSVGWRRHLPQRGRLEKDYITGENYEFL